MYAKLICFRKLIRALRQWLFNLNGLACRRRVSAADFNSRDRGVFVILDGWIRRDICRF